MSDYAILDEDHQLVPTDFEAMRAWRKSTRKHEVGRTQISDTIQVWTSFFGTNHGGDGEPDMWYETLVMGLDLDDDQEHYATWADALAGHRRTVALIRAVIKGNA